MTSDRITHEAIAASAGSGKTFQLAHRYIRLLAGGVQPDRIIALTFSRKAAGEIFDSIVKYLRQAAGSPEQARQTAQRIGQPQLEQGDFLQLLRALLDSLHRLHVGTLDSFTIGVIRTFPMELGISTDFRVMDSDGAQAKTARREVLGQIFSNRHVDRKSQREFLEAFKQATYGQEEKGLERSLDTFISEYREYYHILPAQDAWGSRNRIWSQGSEWFGEPGDISALADRLHTLLSHEELAESIMNRWNAFLEAVRAFGGNSPWTREVEYLAEKLLEDVPALRQGNATIKIERTKLDLSPQTSSLALALVTHVMSTELGAALEKTQGIYRVLDQYERFYEDMVRRRGKLTFADAQYLLTPANSQSGGSLISRIPDQDTRLYIDYRLDCQLDHWLLDEFQDTSDLQWEVLHNLADEILQDVSGQRSFFYVGDVKQAIYGWRGGNARLFNKILEQYGAQIRQHPMNTSFRSCRSVIDTVNRIFTGLPPELPPGAIAEWERIWREHRCREDFVPKHGYVGLLVPPCSSGEVKPSDEDRYLVVSRLLKEIDPLHRGLSAAILVRSNENGKRVVNLLRRECPGMKIVHEGRASIKDNPVVSLLLSLVKFAAHPGDSFAWRHVEMSPLGEYMTGKGLDRNDLSLQLLREIQTDGFKALIRTWGARLDRVHRLDDFGRLRLDNLINAAAEFDSTGSHDVNSFLHFIDNYQIHELAADDAVRVMTIHQSKGLGFDIVILPDLQGRSMANSGDPGLVTARDPVTNHPLWALRMPRRLVARNDPVLGSQMLLDDEAACFDAFCVLYVALTRARQGLYMVTSFPGKSAQALTSAGFLKMQLCAEPKPKDGPPITIDGAEFTCLFETGERDWYAQVAPRQPEIATESQELPKDFHGQPSLRRRLARIAPSEQVEHEQNAAQLFGHDFYEDLEFGTAIHDLFEKISWSHELDIEEVVHTWRQTSSAQEEFKERVAEHFRQSLVSEEIRQALSRPEGKVDLWREKPFEVVLENQWVTGAFDRVVVVRGPEGKALEATIIDFKTDEVEGDADLTHAAEGYRSQLSLYGKALARMLQIDPSRIRLRLVFTHIGRVCDLD